MISRFTLIDLSFPEWLDKDDNFHYGKKLYTLARRLQFLYNDVRKSIDNGSITKFEVYGIYYISQNLLMEMGRLPTVGKYWKFEEHSLIFKDNFKNTKYDIDAQCANYLDKIEDPNIVNELVSNFGENYDSVIIAYKILGITFRIFERYIYSYTWYIEGYDESPIFDLPHNAYIVMKPFQNFDTSENNYHHGSSYILLEELKHLDELYKEYHDNFVEYEKSKGNLVN